MEINNVIEVSAVSRFDGNMVDFNTGEVKKYSPSTKIYYMAEENKDNKKGYFQTFIKAPYSVFEDFADKKFPLKIELKARLNGKNIDYVSHKFIS